jgi:hypothetical protein
MLGAGASAAILIAILFFIFHFVGVKAEDVVSFYALNLRGSLFGGFLTVAAFLFSLKTFIVISMKENVYGTEKYEKIFKERKKLFPELKRYGPLSNLSDLLFLSILISLVAALLQFTVGIFSIYLLVLLCVGFAVWAMEMIFISLFFMRSNLKDWFDTLE